MTKRQLIDSFDEFTRAYIECLLFTTSEDEFPEYCYSGQFSADRDDYLRFDMDSLKRIQNDCAKFQLEQADRLERTGVDAATNGRDFAYSRNRHGVSFQDRAYDYGYPRELAQELVNASHVFGEIDLWKLNKRVICVG